VRRILRFQTENGTKVQTLRQTFFTGRKHETEVSDDGQEKTLESQPRDHFHMFIRVLCERPCIARAVTFNGNKNDARSGRGRSTATEMTNVNYRKRVLPIIVREST